MCVCEIIDRRAAVTLWSAMTQQEQNDSTTNHQPARSPLANCADDTQDANSGDEVLMVMGSGVKSPGGDLG